VKPTTSRAQRFTRRQRLTHASEFSRVMAQAVRSSDKLFTVLARDNELDGARLGLAIARKAARRAVDRNRIKRVSREAFRQCEYSANVDIIVFARHAAAAESRQQLRHSLNRHFQRLMSERTA